MKYSDPQIVIKSTVNYLMSLCQLLLLCVLLFFINYSLMLLESFDMHCFFFFFFFLGHARYTTFVRC